MILEHLLGLSICDLDPKAAIDPEDSKQRPGDKAILKHLPHPYRICLVRFHVFIIRSVGICTWLNIRFKVERLMFGVNNQF